MEERQILALMEKFSSSNIVELQLNEGNLTICLRKAEVFAQGKKEKTEKSDAGAASEAGSGPTENLGIEGSELITAPIVATFYASPSPDAPAFVQVGSKVKAGDTLCVLEAMKQMNHLEAEFDCEILKLHAKSGDFVEFGQPLFTVKRL
jgi:acetyl-CoA carboxylase biotin carboxyl carrier protein